MSSFWEEEEECKHNLLDHVEQKSRAEMSLALVDFLRHPLEMHEAKVFKMVTNTAPFNSVLQEE